MSHHPERKEKNCLNCGTIVTGRYCQNCGQENIEPKETVWQLASHFFNDITHFDGKFFTTLKDLIKRPGFLSKEYMQGRRVAYLNPVRMYVFTSAIFFLLFFSFLRPSTDRVATVTVHGKNLQEIDKMDSASFAKFTSEINKEDEKPAAPMTREEFKKYIDSVLTFNSLKPGKKSYATRKQYDSLRALNKINDSWIERQFVYKQLELEEKYKSGEEEQNAFVESLLHSLPQMLFVSLPLFALLLKLLYVRRKQFYYTDHFIFSLHLYVFVFIDLLVALLISKLNNSIHWQLLNYIYTLLILSLFVYAFIAMKKFYGQRFIKTFLKFVLLLLLFFIVLLLLFAIFILLSFFKI